MPVIQSVGSWIKLSNEKKNKLTHAWGYQTARWTLATSRTWRSCSSEILGLSVAATQTESFSNPFRTSSWIPSTALRTVAISYAPAGDVNGRRGELVEAGLDFLELLIDHSGTPLSVEKKNLPGKRFKDRLY